MTKTPNHRLSAIRCPVSLADVDLFSAGAQEHWYEAYDILHQESPVHRIPGEGTTPDHDGFILTRYEDISRVVRDPVRFPPTLTLAVEAMSREADSEAALAKMNAMMVSIMTLRPTDELWRAHRQQLTDPWVGPGASRHEAMITRIVDELIDQWIDKPEIEFISEFARPLPQRVMANVLGFPETDIPRLARWGEAQVMAYVYGRGHLNVLTEEQAAEQFRELEGFKEYVQQQVEEKRRNPGDDMISFLTDVEYSALGRKLTDVEINGVVYAMLIGGLETTQYAIEEQAQLLCEQPEVFSALKADHDRIRQFIEEGMRLRSPTQGLSTRTTSQDEEFQGVKVPSGSILHLRWGAANVDETEFANARQLDLNRRAVSRHLAFSAGPRVCPGAGLSRLEQTIAWQRLLTRLDSITYAEGNTFQHQPGIMLGTLELKLNIEKAQ